MPQPQKLGFIMRAKVNTDHTTNTAMRRSRTGFKIDVSPELGHNEVEYYMSLIDMMGWMAEIVRVDKCLK